MTKIPGMMPLSIVMVSCACYCEYCDKQIPVDQVDAAEQTIHVYNAPGETTTETIYECEECRDARYSELSEFIA
jgi:hypothetical protein